MSPKARKLFPEIPDSVSDGTVLKESRGHTLIMTKGTNLVLKKTGGKLLFEIIPMSERYGIERLLCVSF